MKLTVYVGYDERNLGQKMAYEVCKRSIHQFNPDISVNPLKLTELRAAGLYSRNDDPKQSTEFTYSRFLVPHLNKFKDYAVFCDSDFLWQRDIKDMLHFISEDKSVAVVQHEYVECPSSTKMDGLQQEWYPRKNWSSLMLFNCAHEDCKKLTTAVVNTETPKFLHRLEWANDSNVNALPVDYNHLVGYYPRNDSASAFHFTDGGPWHQDYINCDHAEKWLRYLTETEILSWRQGQFWAN